MILIALQPALVAGCSTPDQLDPLPDSPFAPGPAPVEAGSVDDVQVGDRLMQAGEFELALQAYFRAASTDGMSPELLSSIGTANLGLERLDQAEAQLRRAIEQDDSLIPAWNNLGVVLIEKGELGEASRVFRTAFALDAGASPEIRENLRLALANMNKTDYTPDNKEEDFELVRQARGQYLLLSP